MPKEKQTAKNLEIVPDYRERLPREIEEPEVCPTCFGTGMEIVPEKGARPCHCRKKGKSFDPLAKMRIPERYRDCTFFSYKTREETDKVYSQVVTYAATFDSATRGMLIIGKPGVGKTHLAISILKDVAARHSIYGLFYEFGGLLKEIQDSYNPNTHTSELQLLAPVLNTELLVLDDLGASKTSDWVKDTLSTIISTRYNNNKKTIFTTNYKDERTIEKTVDKEYVKRELYEKGARQGKTEQMIRAQFESYSDQMWANLIKHEQTIMLQANETLEERIGRRLRSRLYEMCKTVYVQGIDYRRFNDSDFSIS